MILAEALVDWARVFEIRGEIWAQLIEHVSLTAIAVLVGVLISLPLSIYAYRNRWSYSPITGVAGILYTIPSVALFAFLLPYTGLTGYTTAEIGLVSYTLLILIRNIVAGLSGVPADAKEAAHGMGLSRRQLLWRVEIPLALPVIMTGIRLATVTTIGLVTVTAIIGKGGLGRFILQGLNNFDTTLSFVGAVLSLALAVLADVVLVRVERRVTPWAGTLAERRAA
ncbi:MAG: ABC transporter permease [Actinomycetota bacterium]|nr:ABC transporter permease [Actinomycetota bacterium]